MKELRRVLIVTVLGFLLISAGLFALFLGSSALLKLGLNGDLLNSLIAVGLAVLLPGSFLVAGAWIPSTTDRGALRHTHLSCSSCGATLMVSNVGAKPSFEPWDHDLP